VATDTSAEIGVIGGSGFYRFLTGAREVEVDTPFGLPSDPISVGQLAGRRVAFVARHGRDHRFPPHQVNYRANLWALRALGVRQVLAPCAVGSLRPELGPGTVVVPDQIVDRTWGRAHTVYDDVGPVVHVSMADPYCARGRAAVLAVAAGTSDDESDRSRSDGDGSGYGVPVTDGGTLVVVNGPRFSTRAESQWHAAGGWSIVGMTGMPEAAVARELAVCYTAIALVTDLDAGVEGGEGVTHREVLRVFAANVERLKTLVSDVVPALPADGDCPCQHSLDGLTLPFELP
jgi:5'-methylthioadenosine phosphorylase